MPDSDYQNILVTGDDAFEFLQGQLTNDLRLLPQRSHILAAWCNPKGRVITLVRVRSIDDGYTLMLPGELADTVVKRLGMFRFRSKVEFAIADAHLSDIDWDGPIDGWLLDNLRNGVPDIRQLQSEQFTPHMLNLDRLDALSLDKGCYTGQEIVARTHYRGATRRRMLRFKSENPVTAGQAVADGDRKIGDVVNAIGNDLLAVVPDDSRDKHLDIGGIRIRSIELPYEPS